jgi:hypothetical protein
MFTSAGSLGRGGLFSGIGDGWIVNVTYKMQHYERPAHGTTDVAIWYIEDGKSVYEYGGRLVMPTAVVEDFLAGCAIGLDRMISEKLGIKAVTIG